jgi:ketosteroid isomerase-like protein
MQTPSESDNLATARRYLEALERGDPEGNFVFFADDVVQEEFPNQLMPRGATRDLAAIRDAARRGSEVMAAQRYEVLNAIAGDNQVALEVQWTGTLAVSFGSVPAGGQLRARFAVFLEFRGGKIVRQRNYDCFDPW